jgi:hypothetical protein
MDHLTSVRRSAGLAARVIPPMPQIPKRVIVFGLLATGAMVGLLAASQLINFGVYNLRLRAFDSDYHTSVFGVVSILAQVAAAAVSGWRGTRLERHRWAWFALGALLAGLVVVRGLTHFNATALAVPLACVFCLVCWLTWRDHRGPQLVVWTGLALMVASLLLHKVGLAADSSTASDYTWPYQILTVVKHGCELSGWMLIALGIAAGSVTSPSGIRRRVLHPPTRALARRTGA